MPRRDDIRSIMILGSGPIIIGQACEFDYSGTQACRALRREGYRVVLVNSNPATIMTDPEFADATYVEPLQPEVVESIIAAERPDAILPTVGGQTGINLTMKLHQRGALERFGVELLGAGVEALELGEDRLLFKQAMEEIGLRVPKSGLCRSLEEARRVVAALGYPLIVRPSFPPGAARAVGSGLEGVRARGHARPRRQRDRGLLGRERRPHGCAHRGLGDGGAAADALRSRVPGDAR
jgi:carbamoyl-phosphate synthase large subunit